jgi:hypothetical protein
MNSAKDVQLYGRFRGNRATLQNLELLKGQKCESAVTLDLECAGFAGFQLANWGKPGMPMGQQPGAEGMLAGDDRRATRGAALPCVSVGGQCSACDSPSAPNCRR